MGYNYLNWLLKRNFPQKGCSSADLAYDSTYHNNNKQANTNYQKEFDEFWKKSIISPGIMKNNFDLRKLEI